MKPSRISFSLTEPQLVDGSKDVTRRLGWQHTREGDELVALRKGMGLKKGERQVVLGTVVVRRVSRERLDTITAAEVRREGFPGMTPDAFVSLFCKANKCSAQAIVTRIEFTFRPKGTDIPHGTQG
jgi:hypothetical protein